MQTCKQQFCPQHRFAKDHDCVAPTSTKSSAARQAANISNQTSAAGAAALAAFKRSINSTPAAAKPTPASQARAVPVKSAPVKSTPAVKAAADSGPSSAKKVPFSKSDR